MTSNNLVVRVAAALVLAGWLGGVAAAPTINLAGVGYAQYGDGLSYSLPIAGIDIGSTPGAIQDFVVLATGSEGGPVTTNFAGMDHAYSTPSGESGETFFYANPFTNRGSLGTINNNRDDTWDSSLAALKTFLQGDQMVFMFNNNQLNGHDEQSLSAWGRVWLTNAAGAVVADSTMEFTNQGNKYALLTEGGGGVFLGDPTTFTAAGSGPGNPTAGNFAATDFVLSGGAVCVVPNPVPGGPPVPVACSTPGASSPVNHNLGADHVAYAVLFPELNAMLNNLFASLTDATLANYTMHADIRLGCEGKLVEAATRGPSDFVYGGAAPNWMACGVSPDNWGNSLNNGFEQLFMVRAAQPGSVPEPTALSLLGLALALWGTTRNRRTTAAGNA